MAARFCAIPLVLACTLTACSGVGDDRTGEGASADLATASADPAWGCLGPQPGHPTAAEQTAFVEEVASLATRAEERHGVPAAAITAIAILESGYGWSRLAQNANNLMGWKYFPDAPAGGRDSWMLECPELGISDRFVVFHDRADGIDFVAGQLASTDNYRADTERYRRDRASGVDVVEAVDRWVDGIADPYSTQPENFRTEVRRLMNETYAIENGPAAEHNLYSLSESVSPARAEAADALES
jgi:hypothetical protein